MWLHWLALLPLTSLAFAQQIPVIDGIIGGVPKVKNNVHLNTLSSAATTPGKLRYVQNSGFCETTPGVNQVSGYADVTANRSLFFWFFESRNDPVNDPLVLWFNGGPGSSSMIGLLQEHGPCRINNDSSTVSLNKFSWNNQANMIYIDQPAGVGFSQGDTVNDPVGTSQAAAADIWTFMQIFLSDTRFSKYVNNTLGLWTESYGGHYGPAFAAHFLSQNTAIERHSVSGIKLNLKVLGIGDGLTDPLAQYPGYMEYAASNPYYPLVDNALIALANTSWTQTSGCKSQISQCYNGGSDTTCSNAQNFCNFYILSTLCGNWDNYYVLTQNPDPYPPAIGNYLNSIRSKIGAAQVWSQSNGIVYQNFANTGDWMRNSGPDLETVINAGVRTVIYVGDADYILNFYGVEAMVNGLQTQFSATYKTQAFQNFNIRGQSAGIYKNAGSLSYVRFYGAGHEVPAYQYGSLGRGEAAAQMFTQAMKNQPLTST
jgi:carboxypeptidase C (cathepsin A)